MPLATVPYVFLVAALGGRSQVLAILGLSGYCWSEIIITQRRTPWMPLPPLFAKYGHQ